MPEAPQDFESALSALEQRVRRLEGTDVALDEALRLFEEGVALARQCHTHLDEAEKRIASLSRGPGGVEESALAEPDPDDGA